jgi:2-oxoglutarate ferredoxin oxidoreductase subunit delta
METAPRIDVESCRGCGICVAFCSRGVLVMEAGRAQVRNPENCSVCRLCELYCPHLCIWIKAETY